MIAPTHELTTKEAAALKGVTTAAISRAIREGRLPARAETQPGRARAIWRIRREDLTAWRSSNAPTTRVAAEAEAARRAAIIAATGSLATAEADAAHRAAVRAATGSLAGPGPTLADFLREKREDLEREEYHPYVAPEGLERAV